ncbi:periplasmic chaperone for outer membrane proteins SurA [Sulfuritortus calidifontis]|uniref:Chaperone SurA n=2 Tax=Sulfuritortus calidifontis TaxID=1914471 RepID=A0A4R3JWN0_9PROT|nr:periplasmic chaperone for outer membrane proteins SurA [Sulfuritortus calidifontis]
MQRVMNSTCRKLLATIAGAALLQGLPTLAAPKEPVAVDRIVAVVNNAVITEHELNARIDQVLRQLARQNTQAPPRRILERQILERMITEQSLLQRAEETNIRIDGAQVDRAIGRIAQQNGMDLATFRAAVEKDGTDFEAFREQIRTEIAIARLREREVDNRITVTEAEIDNLLANPALKDRQQNEYLLAHILITTPEGASPDRLQALKAKADKALAELKAGADFAQISAAYSNAQNALEGGQLGWRNEGQLPSLYVAAAKALKPGQVSDVLRSPNGFHIVKLVDLRGKDAALVIRQTHARHILIKTNEVVSDQDAKNRLTQLKERIDNGQDFAALAKLHSDDLSAAKGGDLGWLNPGDTVPQFERVMDSLKPGEVSEPIQSPFGWHLIQVLERRDQDVTQERKRLDARRAIRERKSDEAFDGWVRQIRDSAYVEIRLDQ